MRLTWYGHSCFHLEWDEGTLVFDPYTPGKVPGLTLPLLHADRVICSHKHGDHNYVAGVVCSGQMPDMDIQQFPSFHDAEQGTLRGDNLITVVHAKGIRLAHLGDLGHPLTKAQTEDLGQVDVLLIPVGGFYTIDAAQAKALIDMVSPSVVVPMHYRRGEQGLQQIEELAPFLTLFEKEKIVYLKESSTELKLPQEQEILVFPWPE